jgi:hypothetical protein
MSHFEQLAAVVQLVMLVIDASTMLEYAIAFWGAARTRPRGAARYLHKFARLPWAGPVQPLSPPGPQDQLAHAKQGAIQSEWTPQPAVRLAPSSPPALRFPRTRLRLPNQG